MFIELVNAASTTVQSPILSNTAEPGDIILLIISLFVLVSWVLSIVFILRWGLLMILSWWKEEKITPALNTIRYAIIWVIITVLTIFIFPILWKLLWLDVEKYAKPSRIFEKIEELWNNVFWWNRTNEIINSNTNLDKLPDDFATDL